MKDVMKLEKIEHEVAEKVFEGTKYNWVDMLDFQSLKDLKKELKNADEETCEYEFKEYFERLKKELDYEQENNE